MIAKRNEFVKKTAGRRSRGKGFGARGGYGNPYFKKGLEKLRHGAAAAAERDEENFNFTRE